MKVARRFTCVRLWSEKSKRAPSGMESLGGRKATPRSSTVGGLGTGSSTGRGHEMVSRSRCVRFVDVAIARRRSDAYLPVIED